MIILDIGAGDGKRCCKWLEDFKDAIVYAFEPDPRNYKELESNVSRMKPSQKRRIKIYNCAVWENDCIKEFYMCNDKSSSSLLPFVTENIQKWRYPPARHYFKTEDVVKVKCVSLSKIMDEERIKIIDYIRIDAQGCAMQIIKGIDRKKLRQIKEFFVKVHIIPFEIYRNQTTKKEIENTLKTVYFNQVDCTMYSRNQEQWLRYHSDVWKKSRNSKIYSLD